LQITKEPQQETQAVEKTEKPQNESPKKEDEKTEKPQNESPKKEEKLET